MPSPIEFKHFIILSAYGCEGGPIAYKLKQEGKVKSKSATEALVELSDSLMSAKEIVKKSVALLDAAKPEVKPALDHLAALVGHTPVHQIIAALPEAARAQIEMLQRSAEETNKNLEEMKKSQIEQAKTFRRKEVMAKAAEFKSVPLTTDEIADLMSHEDPSVAEKVTKMLSTVNVAMKKSAIFAERGSSAPGGQTGALERLNAIASEMIQKSASKGEVLAKSKAMTLALQCNPELAKQAEAERAESLKGMSIGI